MSSIIGAIAYAFGAVLLFLYQNLWFNFGLAIIVLTILIKILLLPLGIKSFNEMSKMTEIQPLMTEIQRKYKNDTETMNKEVMKLYQEKKANPFGGCLPLLIQMPIFIGLLWVMAQPLTYMFSSSNDFKNELIVQEIYRNINAVQGTSNEIKGLKNDLYVKVGQVFKENKSVEEKQFKTLLSKKFSEVKGSTANKEEKTVCDNLIKSLNDYYMQIRIIKNDPDLVNLHNNMNFLGINLTEVPPDFITRKVNANNIILLLFPLLSGVSTYLSAKYGQIPTSGNTVQNDSQAAMQKQMLLMMPLMSAWFSMVVPVGLSLYWLISNVFQLMQQKILIEKYLRKKEAKA
jgi:YidC/Oxa1 family membrane protein insertase